MADSRSEGATLEAAWLGFGQCVAVAAGAAFALLSLLFHVPVWVAALRGGLLFICLLIVVRATLSLVAAMRADAQPEERRSKPRNTGGKSG
jgi:heme A synthase